jgi:hypothetical protein
MVGCDTADKHCKIWQHLNCDSRTGREYGWLVLFTSQGHLEN